MIAQFALVGRPSTLHTTELYCWSGVKAIPALRNTSWAELPEPHERSMPSLIEP
jgi:hypothetical protein